MKAFAAVALICAFLGICLGPASAATTEDAAQNQKITALETELHEVEAFVGFKHAEPPPPVEEPPLEEPPAEEPPVEPPVEESTGTQTLHCFANPAACGYPSPQTTGPTGPLAPSGSIKVTKAGEVVRGKDISGTLVVAANNVTVEDVRVTQTGTCGTAATCGNYAIGISPGVTGVKLVHVETRDTPGKTCQQDIRNGGTGLVIEASYLHACDGNLWTYEPVTMKDSYALAKIDIPSDHIENVYLDDTTFTGIHDTFMNPVWQTANVFGNSNGGTNTTACKNHITIEDSLLAGGGYQIYPCAHASQVGSSTLVVRDNHFARCSGAQKVEGGHHLCPQGTDASGYFPNGGSYGVDSSYFGGTWTGNVWDDDGAPVTP